MLDLRSKTEPAFPNDRRVGGEHTPGPFCMTGIVRKIATNIEDVRHFGPSILLRHLPLHARGRPVTASVKGIGPVQIRGGTSDIACLRQIFIEREYDLSHPLLLHDRIQAHYHSLLAQGVVPVIADIGANIGAASLWFRAHFPESAIVAVEPDPENADMLKRNLQFDSNCHIIEAAIGSRAGHVSLENAGEGWAVRTQRSSEGIKVVTVDEVVATVGGGKPFIIKIDIEGFESDLFSENLDWISRSYAVMIEPHDWMLPGQMTSRSFQQAMACHPFEMFIRGENILYVRL